MPKYLPQGTQFLIGSVPVGGLTAVGLPDRSKGEAETTDTDSAGWREFMPGLRDGGSLELTFRHIPDDPGQTALEDNYELDGVAAITEMVIRLPESATDAAGNRTYTFDAYVATPPNGELALADDEASELTATIRVSGGVTIA